ncbi:MAG: alpha/beta hydrolase [Microthrixaceae bacterium]
MSERRSLVTRAITSVLALPDSILDRLVGAAPVAIDGRVLNRRLQAMLVLSERLGIRPEGETQSVSERRSDMRRATRLAMPVRTGLHVVDRRIPGPAGEIPVRIYRRFGLSETAPAIVFLHGGGWVTGDLDTHDGSCRLLADESECIVIAVDYRLAPEHPFPAGIDDAVAAYRWVHDHTAELSIEPGRVGVMGDSAGGNLAAVVAQVTRDTDVPAPVAQCLIYPATDAHMREASHRHFAKGFFLTRDSMEWFRAQYLPDPSDWDSPLASPIEQKDLVGVAPALVVTAGFDPLRDEGRRYAEMLVEAGVPTRYRCYDDMVHGFFGMGILPGGMDMATEICLSMGDLMHDTP